MSTSGIFCKIDWYSAVFESCSINDVLSFLHLEHENDDFFANSFTRALGYDTQVTYAFDGVSIAVSYSLMNHFAADQSNLSVFDFIFDRLRLEISGFGLDMMRDKWIELGCEVSDFDNFLRTEPELPRGQMHITRCDFAFDLIDYKPEFLDTIIDHLSTVTHKRVPICHMQGGLNFSVRTGDQKTVYLGSPRSDKMLRIYDKRMQLTDANGIWTKSVDYPDCSSWIRIELQTRNGIAHGLCLGEGDFTSIFRYIYEQYCFRDITYEYHTCKPVQFWDELFDWENIPPIIQNLHFTSIVSTLERAERYVFGTAFKSILILIAVYKKHGFLDKLDAMVSLLQSSDDYNLNRKFRSLLLKLHCAADGKEIASLPGVAVDYNNISFI